MTDTTMKPIALCSTCVFFAGIPDPKQGGAILGGVCKRFPPTPIVIYGTDVIGKQAASLQSHFPPVSTGEFCGEHCDASEFYGDDDDPPN